MPEDEEHTRERILKDIRLFYESYDRSAIEHACKSVKHVMDLSEMYAKDAESYLKKGDLYTAFSCISYAHGLLDALKEINGAGIGKEV
ncbi:MAG: DUF357 domain-containing protein [Candidatus Micrarchaeia archaeon]